MSRITVRLNSAEQRALNEITWSYDGNLAAAMPSLIHREAITKAVSAKRGCGIKSALVPLLEAGDLTQKPAARFLETEMKNAGNLAGIRGSLMEIVEHLNARKQTHVNH